jgi:hypothetical protein
MQCRWYILADTLVVEVQVLLHALPQQQYQLLVDSVCQVALRVSMELLGHIAPHTLAHH